MLQKGSFMMLFPTPTVPKHTQLYVMLEFYTYNRSKLRELIYYIRNTLNIVCLQYTRLLYFGLCMSFVLNMCNIPHAAKSLFRGGICFSWSRGKVDSK